MRDAKMALRSRKLSEDLEGEGLTGHPPNAGGVSSKTALAVAKTRPRVPLDLMVAAREYVTVSACVALTLRCGIDQAVRLGVASRFHRTAEISLD